MITLVKILVRLAIGLAVVGVVIQFVPYGRDHANPAVLADAPWPDAESRRIAVQSCYDCHSNETKWLWYSNIAPMSWLVQRDVDEGREKLNFSEWGRRRQSDESAEAVENGSMPPTKYTVIHWGARLSSAEKAKLIAALKQIDASARSGRG